MAKKLTAEFSDEFRKRISNVLEHNGIDPNMIESYAIEHGGSPSQETLVLRIPTMTLRLPDGT